MSKSKESATRSIPAGGPATINGILYQFLWSLLRATSIHIQSVLQDDSESFQEVRLTLEPAGGGGDLVVGKQPKVVVEQLKARPDGSTWSLREIIEGVIPDLYLGCSHSMTESTFRFVTEGRMGRWDAVYRFFQSLRRRECPADDPISGLDSVNELRFGGHKGTSDSAFWNADSYTEVTLFEKMVAEVRRRSAVNDIEDELATQRKLWHLLGSFKFLGGQESRLVQQEVDSHLLALVDHHDDLPRIRDAMALDLARRATEGSAEICVEQFFQDHGLNAVPLGGWSHMRLKASQHVETFLVLRGYEPTLDVRSARAIETLNDWSIATPILDVTGESGQGKSWRAYRMAIEARTSPPIVVIIDAVGNADMTLQRAAESLWQDIAGHDALIRMPPIAERIRRVTDARIWPWLFLVIDGVQNLDEATSLVRQPWEDWGVRALITCHPQLSRQIEQVALGRCAVVSVNDFDVDELHEYLARCFGDDWPDIPDTIWRPLRRPLLANVYRQIANDPEWRPESEYELYAEFWKRLDPLDGAALKRLAVSLLKGARYPWSDQELAGAGVDGDTLERMNRCGWLRWMETGAGRRFEVSHDRLLNWLVAAVLVDSLRDGTESVNAVGNRLRDLFGMRDSIANRFLGFVPMDFLWMAFQDDALEEQVPLVLEGLEKSPIRPDEFYMKLIPTLGACAVGSLVHRLKQIVENPYLRPKVATAIGLIGGSTAAKAARELLNSDDPLLQRAAMGILVAQPVSDALDRIWELHIASQAEPYRYLEDNEPKWTLYQESFAALRECCRKAPDWLNSAIQQSNPQREPTETLAYLIAAIRGETGRRIWTNNKLILKGKVPLDKQRCLATCIRCFSDSEEIDWLAENVSRTDELVGPMALSALAQLAPAVAIDRLHTVRRNHLSMTRNWYADQLFARQPDQMKAKLLTMMRETDEPWKVAAVFRGSEQYLEPAILRFLLDDFSIRLEAALAVQEWGTQEPLFSELQFLASLGTREQLQEFRQYADSKLESMLVGLLLRIGPRRGVDRDSSIRDAAMEVVYRIAGKGFTQVVNRFLQGETVYGRLDSIRCAVKRPDEETIRLLAAISESAETWDGHYIEQCLAAECLADVGEWGPVLRLVEHIGLQTLHQITDLRRCGWKPPAELISDMRSRIHANPGEASPGDLLVLGIGGHKSDTDLIRSTLATSAPESDSAHACVIALELLQDDCEESVVLLCEQLAHHEYSATNALIVNRTQVALQCLREHAQGRFNLAVGINLVNGRPGDEEAFLEARHALETELQRDNWLEFNTNLELFVRNIQSNDAVETILQSAPIRVHVRKAAFAGEGSGWITGSKAAAIRILARFDSRAAFLAAKTALHNVDWHDRDQYPYILMELDRQRAIPLLLSQLQIKQSAAVKNAIYRSMLVDRIDDDLAEHVNSPDPEYRKAACIVSGWVTHEPETESLLQRLLSDPEDAVSRAAADALSRIERRRKCRQLATEITEEPDRSRRWLLLDVLLSLSDPGDDHSSWPTEGPQLGNALSPLQRNYVTDCLKRQREKCNR